MDIGKMLDEFKNNSISKEELMMQLKKLPYEDIGFAKLDHHRPLRKGLAEVVYCQGKTTEQVKIIIQKLIQNNSNILATKATKDVFKAVRKVAKNSQYNELAKTISIVKTEKEKSGKIAIITAGTADIPVAEEAYETARIMGNEIVKLYDVGVAGIHRILGETDKIDSAKVIIVVAGMEGALASVVGGLASCPVIAVPTSVGYGASFGGIAALLSMLNTCSPGVTVVNIDNGFGAGYMASMINQIK